MQEPVEYATLLSYVSPRQWEQRVPFGNKWRDLNFANQHTLALKNNCAHPNKDMSIYDYVARTCTEQNMFSKFFNKNAVLVPVPGSCPHQPGSMWAPELLANAMKKYNLGRSVAACLERTRPVRKSSQSPGNRVLPTEHYDTMAVNSTIPSPTHILLVDDVITKGSTFLGSAWLLSEAYPDAKIKAFAAVRATNLKNYKKVLSPCTGTIQLTKSLKPRKSPCKQAADHVQTSLFGK